MAFPTFAQKKEQDVPPSGEPINFPDNTEKADSAKPAVVKAETILSYVDTINARLQVAIGRAVELKKMLGE